ncbi:flagellar hook-basal body complex protein FliE [Agromyces soli]
MAVEAVGGLAGAGGARSVAQTGYLDAPAAVEASGAAGSGGTAFAGVLGAIDGTQALQSEAKALALQAVTGDLTDIHRATLASSRAAVTLELVAAVRNKSVEAFNEIMRMQA